jgi:hypothetical protein
LAAELKMLAHQHLDYADFLQRNAPPPATRAPSRRRMRTLDEDRQTKF